MCHAARGLHVFPPHASPPHPGHSGPADPWAHALPWLLTARAAGPYWGAGEGGVADSAGRLGRAAQGDPGPLSVTGGLAPSAPELARGRCWGPPAELPRRPPRPHGKSLRVSPLLGPARAAGATNPASRRLSDSSLTEPGSSQGPGPRSLTMDPTADGERSLVREGWAWPQTGVRPCVPAPAPSAPDTQQPWDPVLLSRSPGLALPPARSGAHSERVWSPWHGLLQNKVGRQCPEKQLAPQKPPEGL